jgi:hypothetical protein
MSGQFPRSLAKLVCLAVESIGKNPSLTHMTRATTISFALALAAQSSAQDLPLPSKERFHLYLLAGQSNMAGRGSVRAGDKVPHQRVLMLSKDLKWLPASDPIHFDKPIAGVGPGLTFGRSIAESQPDITVGLIPCAVGGSPIETWIPGATTSKRRAIRGTT